MDEKKTNGSKSLWARLVEIWKPVYSFVIAAAAFTTAILTIISVFKKPADPEPPDRVQEDTSRTRTAIMVPELTALDYTDALDSLRKVGLIGDVTSRIVTLRHRHNTVIQQQPPAESSSRAGETISLDIASNPQELLAIATTEWQPILMEQFDTRSTRFRLGRDNQPEYERKTEIAGQRLGIEFKAQQAPVFSSIRPRGVDALMDFYLAVEAVCVSKPADIKGLARYGLVFRYSGEDLIAFRLSNQGTYEISSKTATGWTPEKGDVTSSAIGNVNRPHSLAVVALDSLIYFYIGGKYQRYMVDPNPQDGNAGLIIAVTESGRKTEVAFDNFELRVPPL